MKIPLVSLFSLALAGFAAADVPKKGALQTYSVLWNKSPFTTPPPPPEVIQAKNPLEDYALIGVSPIGSGDEYRVTMINKKKPDEPRKLVYSGATDAEFEIIKVTRKSGDPMGTVVTMKSGTQIGTVAYDEKLLTIATPVAAKPQVPQPGQPPIPAQNQIDPNNPPRMPRPRVVPPPPPANVPQPQVQPQGQPQHSSQRPERRRN